MNNATTNSSSDLTPKTRENAIRAETILDRFGGMTVLRWEDHDCVIGWAPRAMVVIDGDQEPRITER